MKDFLELARERCSVRKYEPRAVEAEKLALLLEAARIAPSAKNLQPWKLLVLDTADGLARLGKASKTFGAPLAIVILADNSEVWVRPTDGKDSADIDATIATCHIMFEAEQLGLSTCWICFFDAPLLMREFSIPGHYTPVNILTIGYAEGDKKSPLRHETERKSLDSIVIRHSQQNREQC